MIELDKVFNYKRLLLHSQIMDNTLKSKYQHVNAIFQKDLDIITDYLLCPITDVSTKTPSSRRDKMVSEQKMSWLGIKGTNLRLP